MNVAASITTGMTELHPAMADMDPRLQPLSEQDFDLAGIGDPAPSEASRRRSRDVIVQSMGASMSEALAGCAHQTKGHDRRGPRHQESTV